MWSKDGIDYRQIYVSFDLSNLNTKVTKIKNESLNKCLYEYTWMMLISFVIIAVWCIVFRSTLWLPKPPYFMRTEFCTCHMLLYVVLLFSTQRIRPLPKFNFSTTSHGFKTLPDQAISWHGGVRICNSSDRGGGIYCAWNLTTIPTEMPDPRSGVWLNDSHEVC